MKNKFKNFEEGVNYSMNNDILEFEVNGKVYQVNSASDISNYKGVPIYRGRARVYKQGGSVFSGNLVANEDSKATSYIDLPQLVPIQAEVGETILLPTGDLVKTNARLRHSKMSDNEVTDIVPEGSYILSQFGDTKIYKSEADQIPLEMQALPYNTYKASKVPTVKTLGDLMGKKKVMAPADLSRKVENKFKIVDSEDPFTKQTNLVNQYNRASYLQAIIGLSEYDKARKGIDNSIDTQMSQNMVPQMVARNGGKVIYKSVQKFQNSGTPSSGVEVPSSSFSTIGAITQGVATLYNIGSNIYDRIQSKKAFRRANNRTDGWRTQALDNVTQKTIPLLASTALQDTKVDYSKYGSQFLENAYSQNMATLQNSLRNIESGAFRNRMDVSSMSPQMANLLGSKDAAARYDAMANPAQQLAMAKLKERSGFYNSLQDIDNKNMDNRNAATNAMRAGRNQIQSTLGSILSGGISDRMDIETDYLNIKNNLDFGQVANASKLNRELGTTLQNTANVAQQMYGDYQSKQAAALAQSQADARAAAQRLGGGTYNLNPPPAESAYDVWRRTWGR